jgi:hypothetical protein
MVEGLGGNVEKKRAVVEEAVEEAVEEDVEEEDVEEQEIVTYYFPLPSLFRMSLFWRSPCSSLDSTSSTRFWISESNFSTSLARPLHQISRTS